MHFAVRTLDDCYCLKFVCESECWSRKRVHNVIHDLTIPSDREYEIDSLRSELKSILQDLIRSTSCLQQAPITGTDQQVSNYSCRTTTRQKSFFPHSAHIESAKITLFPFSSSNLDFWFSSSSTSPRFIYPLLARVWRWSAFIVEAPVLIWPIVRNLQHSLTFSLTKIILLLWNEAKLSLDLKSEP